MFMTMVCLCHESFSHRVTETQRKSFFSLLCVSVAIFFHAKEELFSSFVTFVVQGFYAFCDTLARGRRKRL